MELRLDATRAVLQLRSDGPALIAAARKAGLDAPVPTCPKWAVRDLMAHVGGLHWSRASIVRDGLTERPESPQSPEADLLDWCEAGVDALVTALRTSDLTREVWTFVGPRPASWWSRRMAHETVIHRADVELAAGGWPPRVDAVVAVDGIDELLAFFLGDCLARFGSTVAGTTGGTGETVGVHTPDERWHVSLHPDAVDVVRGSDSAADVLIAGTPSHVLYHLWGRLPADEVDTRGDPAALAAIGRALRQVTGG